jgi:hypothetical protein
MVDQLSYGVSLAMHCLSLRFITFCPPHPDSIPGPGNTYGVPARWPSAIKAPSDGLSRLRQLAHEVEDEFTNEFNRIIAGSGRGFQPIASAFGFTSAEAIIFNYPGGMGDRTAGERDISGGEGGDPKHGKVRPGSGPSRIHIGYCFEEQDLDPVWEAKIRSLGSGAPKILVTMGSFLSARADVLRNCTEAALQAYPDAAVIVGAGASRGALSDLRSDHVLIESIVPQQALLREIDVLVHHGGCGSFTEALYHGCPMLVLPFSSDQFSVARDVEESNIGEVLEPNSFTSSMFSSALERAMARCGGREISRWRQDVRARGPAYGVLKLEAALS